MIITRCGDRDARVQLREDRVRQIHWYILAKPLITAIGNQAHLIEQGLFEDSAAPHKQDFILLTTSPAFITANRL